MSKVTEDFLDDEYVDDEYDEYDFADTIIGEGGMTMYHVGDGVYCDDDGDNWDFF